MINPVLEKKIIIKNNKNIQGNKEDIFSKSVKRYMDVIVGDYDLSHSIQRGYVFGDTNLVSINLIYDYDSINKKGLICFKFIFNDETGLLVRDDILDIKLIDVYGYLSKMILSKLINLHKKDRFKINGYDPNMLIEDKLSIFLMDTNNFFRETHNFITDCKKYMKEIE